MKKKLCFVFMKKKRTGTAYALLLGVCLEIYTLINVNCSPFCNSNFFVQFIDCIHINGSHNFFVVVMSNSYSLDLRSAGLVVVTIFEAAYVQLRKTFVGIPMLNIYK